MLGQKEITTLLIQLQHWLKRQFLLVEREQQEKNKIKGEIENELRKYYVMRGAQLTTDTFDNSYSFIKDVITLTSRNLSLAVQLIRVGSIELIPQIVNGLYERVEKSQGKDIVLLACKLLKLLFQQIQIINSSQITINGSNTFANKILHFLNHYLNREQIKVYFQKICKRFISSKDIIQVLKNNICNCPESLSSVINALYEQSRSITTVWCILLTHALLPLREINPILLQQQQQQLNKLKKCYYLKDSTTIILHQKQQNPQILKSMSEIIKQVRQIKRTIDQLQVSVYGACLNCSQIKLLITTIIQNRATLTTVSEKVVNRSLKVQEMSPTLAMFDSNYDVILNEFVYSQMIEKDYHKMYSTHYSTHPLKNIIRQILVETTSIHSLSSTTPIQMKEINKKYSLQSALIDIFTQLERQEQSISLNMKIKYALKLLRSNVEYEHVIEQMREEFRNREKGDVQLYRETKFSLLKAYCNIKKSREENSINIMQKYGQKIALSKVYVCITSSDSSLKYRVTNCNDISICQIRDCMHRNTETYHAYSIYECVEKFANLEQVKQAFENYDSLTIEQIKKAYLEMKRIILKDVIKTINNNSDNNKSNEQIKKLIVKIVLRALQKILLGQKQKKKKYKNQTNNIKILQTKRDKLLYENILYLQPMMEITHNIKPMNIDKQILPLQKMSLIKNIYQEHNLKHQNLFKSIVKAAPINFFSQLTFIELFLKQEKLLSLEGIILKQVREIANNIHDMKLQKYLLELPLINRNKRSKSN